MGNNSFELEKALEYLDNNQDESLKRLFEILRIPSISTNNNNKKDCIKAADWFVQQLKDIGFKASIRKTTGHPMVIAHFENDGPHFLFYGHYDVQPVDPLDLWDHDPFDPKIENTSKGKVIKVIIQTNFNGQKQI